MVDFLEVIALIASFRNWALVAHVIASRVFVEGNRCEQLRAPSFLGTFEINMKVFSPKGCNMCPPFE
jgi:hypothetical protein